MTFAGIRLNACSARIPNLSGYVSGCRLRNGVPRCVTGCPDAQLQIYINRLHNGAVPLRNRASSRLSRYATGAVLLPDYEAVPLRNRARSRPFRCPTCRCVTGVNVKWGPPKMPGSPFYRDNGPRVPILPVKWGPGVTKKHRENRDPPVKMGTPPTGNSIGERSSSVAVWNSSMP